MAYSMDADKGIGAEGGKAELLRSLSIERSAPAPSHTRRRFSATASLLALVAAAASIVAAPAAWRLYSDATVDLPMMIGGGPKVAQTAPPPPSPTPATVGAPASTPSRASDLIATGYVVARREATVAAEITGKVKDLLVDEGQAVVAGQVLARLDSVLAEADLALSRSRTVASEAAIAAIAADLADAERILNRTRDLSQKNFATEADLTKAQANVDKLRAQLRQAQAQHQTDQLDAERNAAVLEKYAIRAPFG